MRSRDPIQLTSILKYAALKLSVCWYVLMCLLKCMRFSCIGFMFNYIHSYCPIPYFYILFVTCFADSLAHLQDWWYCLRPWNELVAVSFRSNNNWGFFFPSHPCFFGLFQNRSVLCLAKLCSEYIQLYLVIVNLIQNSRNKHSPCQKKTYIKVLLTQCFTKFWQNANHFPSWNRA